jgi:KipI family sensor histidine kinase inhibitor
MRVIDASDSSVLVVFGDEISPDLNRRVIQLFHDLQKSVGPSIRNLHPAYASLLIDFDPLLLPATELRALIAELTGQSGTVSSVAGRHVIKIPVCYGGEMGPDLPDVAAHTGFSADEVIARHSSVEYTVYFIGFSPGFPYMGGLPEALATPRLKTPRTSVPAGSVGIGGSQTGLYPMQWSGGWRLIGRTPMRMFDPEADPPSRLQPGDVVKFTPITREIFDAMVAVHLNESTAGSPGTPG